MYFFSLSVVTGGFYYLIGALFSFWMLEVSHLSMGRNPFRDESLERCEETHTICMGLEGVYYRVGSACAVLAF